MMAVRTNAVEASSEDSVALVLALEYGDAISSLSHRMPVWIVESKANLAGVERARMAKDSAAIKHLTTFHLHEGETVAAACERIILSLDEHYDRSSSDSPYRQLVVIGVTLGQICLQPFLDCGFDSFVDTGEGFAAMKSTP